MSKREDRLNKRATELRALEHVAQVRVRNAEHGVGTLTHTTYPQTVHDAFKAELEEARAALRAINQEQQELITDLGRHTTDFPDMAMVMVETPDGYQVFEHRDPDGNGTSNDETGWYHLNAPDDATPMTFDDLVCDVVANNDGEDRYVRYPFYRLYTQEEVDNLLDKALGY